MPRTPGSMTFRKKNPGFFEIQRTIDTSMGSAALEIMHLVSIEPLLASAVLARSIKVLGWQPGAPKFREHDFPKKNPDFFEIQRTIDTSMGSAALEIMHMVSKESLLSRAVFTKSINVLGWQAGPPKSREHDFSKKKSVLFF